MDKKKYMFADDKQPIYIKTSDWKECNMIESKMDYICSVNMFQKQQLNKQLKESIDINKKYTLIA